jgi:hypothetical protein
MTLTRLRYSPYHPGFPGKQALLFTGFADDGIRARDGQGDLTTITGLYAALSFDEGKTWPEEYRRVISNLEVNEEYEFEGAPWQRVHTLSRTKGQEHGYISATQSPDGMIYLTDGKIVYSFNQAWLLDGSETGIREELREEAVQIKPNPCSGRVTIDFGRENTEGGQVDIFSLDGKRMYQQELPHLAGPSIAIDLPRIGPGCYLLKIRTKDNSYEKKLLIV